MHVTSDMQNMLKAVEEHGKVSVHSVLIETKCVINKLCDMQ